MTSEIKLKITLDNGQFVAAVTSSRSAADAMNRALGAGGAAGTGALNNTAAAARNARDAVSSLNSAARQMSFGDVAKGAIAFSAIESAARGAAGAILSIPRQGITFIAETEVAELGMAGILQSMTEIQGQAPSFAQAQDMAAGAVSRLQKAAAETAASSNDLIATYRAILGPALAAGMSMQQVERFTVVGANAVKSMGLTTGQMVQELRDLTQGGITAAGSTLATALGLKDSDIAKAKNSSEGLFSFLMNRMQGFASTSDAYSKTLKGGWEALGEQVTQASARAMAPAAEAAKGLIAQASAAFKGDQVKSAMAGMGQGAATLVNGLASGIGIVQQYGGAISAMAAALALVKLGSMAGDLANVTSAKLGASAASRLAAATAALEANANNVVTQSSRQQLAALLAEQRAKVAALAQEQALTAAKLRAAQATAAQLAGQARLNALEQQVLPLRQQHAQQTAALAQAQNGLAAATNAASLASRTMGMVVGALGGPIGIAITAATLLAGAFMSARSEAEKLGKTKLSVERVEGTLAAGGKIDQTDAGRVQSALSEAKEQRDALLAESKKPASMSDRSKGVFGGASNVEKRAAELAKSEADVKRLEALSGRIDAAQAKTAAVAGDVNLRGGVSSKALDEIIGGVKTEAGIKEAGATRLTTLEKLATEERALLVKRNATAQELAKFDAKVVGAKGGIQRDTALELQSITKKGAQATGGGESAEAKASAIERAGADLRLAQLKASAQSRVQVLDAEMASADQRHQMGLTGVSEYESERVRIQREKLNERISLIDAEIKAEEARKPKAQADQLQVQRRVVDLKADRSAVQAEIRTVETGATAANESRALDRQRQIAADTAQVWQDANNSILQMRANNASAAMGMLTDPADKLRAEMAAQIGAVQRAADDLSEKLKLRIEITRGEAAQTSNEGIKSSLLAQADQMEGQRTQIAQASTKAIELANAGMTERLKPGWQTMVEGWADANKLMRESSDRTMDLLVSGGEDAFVEFAKTGKLNLKSLADSMISELARTEYRKFIGGQAGGAGGGGMIASLFGKMGAKGDFVGPMPEATGKDVGVAKFSEQVEGVGPVIAKFAEGLAGGTGKLGDFIGGLGSSLSGLFSGGGAAGGGGGFGGIINMVASLFAADGASFAGGGARRFASGGSFTNQIVSQDTNFRFREGGKDKLGLMGEAGPEAIMPLSGGGVQAIGADGRKLGNLAVQRGAGGRLSVVLAEMQQSQRSASPRQARFAAGGTFGSGSIGSSTAAVQQRQNTPQSLQISAPVNVYIQDMSAVQTMINQALAASRRDLSAKLKQQLGVTV